MANEKLTIPNIAKLCVTMIGFVAAVWVGGWSASRIYSVNSELVISHERRLSTAETAIHDQDKRIDGMEKMYIRQEAAQKALLEGLNRVDSKVAEQNQLMIKQIEASAETRAWIKSIDKVKDG